MVPVQEPDTQAPGGWSDAGVALDDDAVVISGMSAALPGCHNISEFAEKLYNKEDMLRNENPRWKSTFPELPKYHGTIPDLDRFDAQFFMVYQALSNNMDAITRKLLEHSYQALFDAGISSTELSGKRVGVYVAGGISESDKSMAFDIAKFEIIGGSKAMYANRISYYLNLKGPSLFVDVNSCGSFVALEQAYQAIKNGQCDAALVGSSKLLIHPQTSYHYHRLIPACRDGKMKCYDMKADGQSLSECVNMLFLQKKKDALRIYARLCHAKAGFAVPDERREWSFGYHRDPIVLSKFLREFYDEAKISPSVVEYVEGFGAAVPEVDKMELQVMEELFCKDRRNPLLIGSVTSNVGFTDAASGITAIIKTLLGYQRGKLAGNINCDNPRQDVLGMRDGRMRILTDHHDFDRRSYAAVNCFSLAGVNGHVLLQGYFKPKNVKQSNTDLPYLLMASGRQESSVQKILDDIKERPLDPEYLALLHNFHKLRISKHLARGYSIYATKENKTVVLREKVDYHNEIRRPLWFVYSGMGSQWAGMGTQLMKLPIFAEAVKRCHQILEPKGVDVINIITSTDKAIFDNVLNSFVGIAAIQIGLTDILRAVGLVPDNIIGHSLGEIGCAYADGCCTTEEMMLIAYFRGLVSIETPLIKGSMAAVGMGYKQISIVIPPEIEVACRNGPTSCTLSGPIEIMQEFVAKLTAQGIFAKEVHCSNIAYHSRYSAAAGPPLLKYITMIGSTPKLRSERWLSTSHPEESWNTAAAMYSSPEYHTNNLLSPVFFEDTLKYVPTNAVLVEIAPHGLLQAILKRSLTDDKHCIPLTRRGHKDNALFLLEALGKLYMEGFNMDISVLYPKIDFPVSTETPLLSNLVEWFHNDKIKICQYLEAERVQEAVYKPIISMYDEEYHYLKGNKIEGIRVFPFAGSLIAVWDTLSMTIGKPKKHTSVQFHNVTFHEQPPLHNKSLLHLAVSVQRGSGRFEVTYEHGLVVDGYINLLNNFTRPVLTNMSATGNNSADFTQADVYKLFYEKGYQYSGDFCSIQSANFSLNHAQLMWNNNWVTLLDGAIQLNALRQPHNGVSQPQYISYIQIDVKKHYSEINHIAAKINEVYDRTICGGLVIEHIRFKERHAITSQSPALKELSFFPFFQEGNIDIYTSLYVFLQIIAENVKRNSLKMFYVSEPKKVCYLDKFKHLLNSPPKLNVNVTRLNKEDIHESNEELKKLDVLFVDNLLSEKSVFESLYHCIPADTFIISLGVETENKYATNLYQQICVIGKERDRLELAQFRPSKPSPTTAAVSIKDSSDLEFLKATRKDLPPQHRLLILTSYPAPVQLKELVQQWRLESDYNQINVLMINSDSRKEDLENLPIWNLPFTVMNLGTWGGEYYVPLLGTIERDNDNATGSVVALSSAQLGDLNSLHWKVVPEATSIGIYVTVHYAGLSFYDAKKAMAEISFKNSADNGFGMDFSGVTQSGDRVMGIVPSGAASGRVKARPELLWPVPAHWSLEDAATVPSAYAHAFYCYTIKLELYPGMSVLIHGATGALGQAAIAIGLAYGCNVFATVSDIKKKRFLMRLFPQLKESHIGNSRDITFGDMIKNETNGLGCQIILCSVTGKFKHISSRSNAMFGYTVDVNQVINKEKYNYGMYHLTQGRAYILVDFTSIFDSVSEMKKLQVLISEGIARGYVRPLSRITYEPHEVPRAFRLLASSRHRGRVLLSLYEKLPKFQHRILCSPDHCQLIICDDKGLGLQLAERLVCNGARKLYLHVPRNSSYFEFKVQCWQKLGVQVYKSYVDLSKWECVHSLLIDANRLASVEGIYNVTTGLAKVTRTRAMEVVANLDSASRDTCHSLRNFVMINEDNAIGYEISLNRARIGLPSLSIQLSDLDKYELSECAGEGVDKNETLKWRIALDAIEQATCSKKAVALTYANPLPRRSLLEEVAALPGVSITSATVGRATLEQVGIDHGRAQDISFLLKKKFNITLSAETIPEMTVADLKKLEDKREKKAELTGFSGYFNYLETDELVADNGMVLMPTLIHTTKMRPDEFHTDIPYLCIVPGMEGHYERFHRVCERLKIAAVVLQPGADTVDETIEDLAHRLIDIMMAKIKLKKHFYLLGYEFGVFVALEMAAILEKRGFTGTIYCIGGTPEEICTTIKLHLGDAGAKLQDDLIKHMFTLMTKLPADKLQLKDNLTWKEKVEVCLMTMRGNLEVSIQYAKAVIETAYARIKLAYQYTINPQRLRSNIVILRAKLPTSSVEVNSFSQMAVHELGSTLYSAPRDLRCAAIINKYLEPEILADFYNRNNCESSFLHNEGDVMYGFVED